MKKLIMYGMSIVVFAPAYAVLKDVGFKIFDKPLIFGKTTKISFELVNKSDKPLWFVLRSGSLFSEVRKLEGIASSQDKRSAQVELDLEGPTNLLVWTKEPKGPVKTRFIPFSVSPLPDKIYSFTPQKTLYLTWDKGGFPRPQTGPAFGLFKKTDSNLSLQQNAASKDIKELPDLESIYKRRAK